MIVVEREAEILSILGELCHSNVGEIQAGGCFT